MSVCIMYTQKIGVVTIPNYGRQAVVEDNNLLKILLGKKISRITISKPVKAAEPHGTDIQL